MRSSARKLDQRVEGASYLREPRPIHFPSEETVPETKRHLMLRTALYQILTLEAQGRFAIGSEQFVFWNARDPNRRLAPDVFVCTGQSDHVFDSWKIWEKGAPDLAVEIASESDARGDEWDRKMERYQEAGIQELVRFDALAKPGQRLRVWDRVQGDLVEREVRGDCTECAALGLFWVVREHPELGSMLRLARDPGGESLLPTLEEARAQEERARLAAEQRVRQLEAELAKVRKP